MLPSAQSTDIPRLAISHKESAMGSKIAHLGNSLLLLLEFELAVFQSLPFLLYLSMLFGYFGENITKFALKRNNAVIKVIEGSVNVALH